jgi:hypothetical protein
MSGSLESIEVQLELTTRSIPPVPPTDILTGGTPKFWRGSEVSFAIGIFDPNGVSVDLSNLAYLELAIYPIPTPPEWVNTDQSYSPFSNLPFPSTPPAPLLSVTVPAGSITPVISRADWLDGAAQNASLVLPWTASQSLNLQGQDSLPFMLVVQGITASGNRIIYGSGVVTVFESGSQGIYLPPLPAPLDVPAGTTFYIAPNVQIPFTLPIRVEGTIFVDGGVLAHA